MKTKTIHTHTYLPATVRCQAIFYILYLIKIIISLKFDSWIICDTFILEKGHSISKSVSWLTW